MPVCTSRDGRELSFLLKRALVKVINTVARHLEKGTLGMGI